MTVSIRKYTPETRTETQSGGWQVTVHVMTAEQEPQGFRAEKRVATATRTTVKVAIEPSAVQMYSNWLLSRAKSVDEKGAFPGTSVALNKIFWDQVISRFLNRYTEFEDGKTYVCTADVMHQIQDSLDSEN